MDKINELLCWSPSELANLGAAAEAALPFLKKGPKGPWKWEDCTREVLKALGLDCGDRLRECCRHAAIACRANYPGREDVWDKLTWTPQELAQVLNVVRNAVKYRLIFCEPEPVIDRPAREKKTPEIGPDGEPVKRGRKKKEAGEAPPPPKPAMPPVPPPPPVPVA